MKKTTVYIIAVSLAFFLTGLTEAFAHKGEPRVKYKRVVVHKPHHRVVFHQPARVRSGYVWIDGHYRWNNRTLTYMWIEGRYVRQKPGKTWVAGRWVRVQGGWFYQPGSWQVSVRF